MGCSSWNEPWLNQVLVVYSHKLCGTIAPVHLARSQSHNGIGFTFPLVPRRVPSVPWTLYGWRLHVDTRSTSLWSMNYIRLVFSNRDLPWICGELPIASAIACVVWGSHGIPLAKNSIRYKPGNWYWNHMKICNSRCPAGAVSSTICRFHLDCLHICIYFRKFLLY